MRQVWKRHIGWASWKYDTLKYYHDNTQIWESDPLLRVLISFLLRFRPIAEAID